MKLSTALLGATVAAGIATAVTPASATLLATVTWDYSSGAEDGGLTITNDYTGTATVAIGTASATGGTSTSARFDMGDIDDYFYGPVGGSIKIGSQTFSGSFSHPYDGTGRDTSGSGVVGYINGTVPEPASLAILGVGLAGIGLARRRRA